MRNSSTYRILQLIASMKFLLCAMLLFTVASTVAAKEYVKYTDRNGVVFWLEDKAKVPPLFPSYYKYVDKNGVAFWVNDIGKIPVAYRNQAKNSPEKSQQESEHNSIEKRQYSTNISIHNNQIIVPVVLKHRGKRVKARMILDTGASVTTLYSGLASNLRLNSNKKKKRVKSISANGAKTDTQLTKVDYIEIDGKILANAEVILMPSQSNIGADGLLGNSFLRFFNFTIDYEHQLLKWN